MAAVACSAGAQAPAGGEGDWAGKIAAGGREYDAQLQLRAASEGSWRAVVPSADICATLRMPVKWQMPDPNVLEIQFLASKALQGCADGTIRFERMDATRFKGRSP